jgi:capsular exopolysaccharide synthesis family protein
MNIAYEGSPLKLKKILSSLFKYKWVNLLILLLFWTLGYFYYKVTPVVYESTATIEIKDVQNNRQLQDIFGNAIAQSAGLETEIDILGSDLLIEKTLKSMDTSISYEKTERFKAQKVYKNQPFLVKNFIIHNPKLYGKKIKIHDLGDNHFSLEVQRSLKEKLIQLFDKEMISLIDSDKTYTFGSIVYNDNVALLVEKKSDFMNENYSFSIHSDISALEKVKQNLSIVPASFQSTILRLTYKDNAAFRAKDFLNSLVNNYLEYSKKNQTEMVNNRLIFINDQLSNINKQLTNSENSLEGYKIENSISDIGLQKTDLLKKVSELKDRLQTANIDAKAVRTLYKEVEKGNYSVISGLGNTYPIMATMVTQLQNLRLERSRLRARFTAEHPDVKSLTDGIVAIEKSIKEIAQGVMNQTLNRKNSIKKDLASYQALVKKLPKKEKELRRHKRGYDVTDNVYNYLLKKQSELAIDRVSQISNKKILDYAHEPERPISPVFGFIMAMSTLLGSFAVLLHTILRARLDVKIKTAEDVNDTTSIPLFGMVPFVKDKSLYNSAYVISQPNSIASEAFRTMRANLDYIVTQNSSKVILISSSVPNEGKTVISANLAATIGMSEKKVVLLSLDLRRPEIHHKFGLSNKVGISDVLARRVSLKEVIWEHELYPNLNIITSGRIPPNPAELIASGRMQEVIEALKEAYDYIIIDTPPLNYVSDAISLFKYADINLFVVKSDFSEQKYLVELEKLMKKLNVQHSGIILNSIKNKHATKAYFDQKYIYYEPM